MTWLCSRYFLVLGAWPGTAESCGLLDVRSFGPVGAPFATLRGGCLRWGLCPAAGELLDSWDVVNTTEKETSASSGFCQSHVFRELSGLLVDAIPVQSVKEKRSCLTAQCKDHPFELLAGCTHVKKQQVCRQRVVGCRWLCGVVSVPDITLPHIPCFYRSGVVDDWDRGPMWSHSPAHERISGVLRADWQGVAVGRSHLRNMK